MRAVIVSDTHGYLGNLIPSISYQKADAILFLGDGMEDAYRLRDELGLRLLAVTGNNDFGFKEKESLFLQMDGKNILMAHGHRQSVYYTLDRLWQVANEKNAELVFYGHTHVFSDKTMGGIRFINPGSASLPRGGDMAGYLVFDFAAGTYERILL